MENIEIENVELEQIMEEAEMDCDPKTLLAAIKIANKFISNKEEKLKKEQEKGKEQEPKKSILNINRRYEDMIKDIERLKTMPSFKTGFQGIDNNLTFSAGTLSVIAAHTSHGKTRFMLDLTQRIISNNDPEKFACMYILFEDTQYRIEGRLIENFQSYKKNPKETINKFVDAGSFCVQNANSDKKTIYLESLHETLIKPFKALHKGKTIVVFMDYIQQIKTFKGEKNQTYKEMKTIVTELKKIAGMEHEEIIIIAGAQNNKEGGIREADDIKQSADNVIDFYNIKVADANTDEGFKHRKIETNLRNFSNEQKEKGNAVVQVTIQKSRDHDLAGTLKEVFVTNGTKWTEYKQNASNKYTSITHIDTYNLATNEDLNFSDNHLAPHMRMKKR